MDSAEDITYFRERTEDLSEEITMLAALLDSDIDETVFEIIEEQVERTLLHCSSGDAVPCSGRPSFDIPAESIEHLLFCGLKVRQIADLYDVSEKTITRRMSQFDIRKIPTTDGESQKNRLELREDAHLIPSVVDANAVRRMNTLAALSMDRSSLMREGLRIQSGMVYPGIQPLSTAEDKGRDESSIPLGYVGDRISELCYKPPSVPPESSLDNTKPPNGFGGLYKSSPPGLQKPVIVPNGGGDGLVLDRRVASEKPSELGLNGTTGSYLRLPWVSPYIETGVYPFLDSANKYALNMYKASFLSQHSHYLPQPLAYSPVCAGSGGAAGSERFLYLPPYPPAPIPSSLASPIRIPTATTAPTLSPLVHCQEKGLTGIGPRMHHEPSAFGHHQQPLHQQPHSERQHSSKQSRTPSSKGTTSSSSSLPVDSNVLLMPAPCAAPHIHQPSVPPPPPTLGDSASDFQKPLPRGPAASSPSLSLPFPYISTLVSENPSPARPSHKPKNRDASTAEPRSNGQERKSNKSPSVGVIEKNQQEQKTPTKDPADKPLDLSAKIVGYGGTPNGYSIKSESSAKVEQSLATRYGLSPRELLGDTLSPSSVVSGGSSSAPDKPEMISSLHSSWVVPGPSPPLSEGTHTKSPVVLKNKTLERVMPQQRSSSCPRIGESNCSPTVNPAPSVVSGLGRPASASPSPNAGAPEKVCSVSNNCNQAPSVKQNKTSKRSESQESSHRPTKQPPQQHLENGLAPSSLFLPQSEPFLPPALAYANRFLHYPVPETLPLTHLGKGPVYPHPIMLGSSNLFQARFPPKQGLPYGLPSSREFLTYQDTQEMVHPLMSPHLTLDAKPSERLERRSRSQDRSRHNEEPAPKNRPPVDTFELLLRPENEPHIDKAHSQDAKMSQEKTKSVPSSLGQDDRERESQMAKHKSPQEKKIEIPKPSSAERKESELVGYKNSSLMLPGPEKPGVISSPSKYQEQSCTTPLQCKETFIPQQPNQAQECVAQNVMINDYSEDQTSQCARTSGERGSEDRKLRQHQDIDKESLDDGDGHDDDPSFSRPRKSKLAKRIANSAGYVGDRFKCVTTELYADSSKLSREQRALQRAMIRFSELELKEKEVLGTAVRDSVDIQQTEERWREQKVKMLKLSKTEDNGIQDKIGEDALLVSGDQETVGFVCPTREANLQEQLACTPTERQQNQLREDVSLCVPPALARKRKHSKERLQQDEESSCDTAPEETREGGDVFKGKKKRILAVISLDIWPERELTTHSSDHLLEESRCNEVKNLKVCIELAGLHPHKQRHLQNLRDLPSERLATSQANTTPSPSPTSHSRKHQAKPCLSDVTENEREVKRDLVEERPTRKRPEGKDSRSWSEENLCRSNIEQDVSPPPPSSMPMPMPLRAEKKSAYPTAQSHDKRQRLKEVRKEGETPRLRKYIDLEKPKGKRQCKTKHICLREHRRASLTGDESTDVENSEDKITPKRSSRKRSASVSDSPPSKPCSPKPSENLPEPPSPITPAPSLPTFPPVGNPPVETPTSRPMPPEARRLIVNKNAGETLLQRAARLGYEEVVLYCLENKVCDVNHRDNAGYCALHEACARGWLTIAQHLLEYGADVNCSAQDGTRPLHDAVENDHLDIVRLLLSYGADPTLATYSGRSILKMTHSELMEKFLTEYFADLQGRSDDDPGLYWDFYGSCVCEPSDDASAFDILADPPGPSDDEDNLKDVFEFEFSDRPLLPCYNIQVSLSQGPRNWLLLSDVLKRLKMTPRAFRSSFSHIEVATISEAEFYKQASLSQLFSCTEDLEPFVPDSKELLDLVEFSSELSGLLGSTLECLDNKWECMRVKRS
ncbi:BCOR protein, partial [Polypterus senegalus]